MLFTYYQITNLKNGKFYIGITERTFEVRITQHKGLLNANRHPNYKLQEDWNNYGENNFDFKVIDTFEGSLEDGYQHEFDLIQKSNATTMGYNILQGGQVNPMYTKEVYEKMKATKQSQVPNVCELKEIEENVFKVVNIYPSQKNIQKTLGYSQANIGRAIKRHSCNYGSYWINETDIKDFEKEWKPYRIKMTPTAQLDDEGNIVKVHHNMVDFCKEYGWPNDAIRGAINRNGKARGIKFIRISEEEYYKIKPITLINNL